MTSTSTQPSEKPAGAETPATGGAQPRKRSLDPAAVLFAALAVLITVVWVGALVFFTVRLIAGLL
jgi:hypothetical protein